MMESQIFKFITYADDTTLFSTFKICDENMEYQLNTVLNKLCEWLRTNKLFLNIKKSKYNLFQVANKKPYHFRSR